MSYRYIFCPLVATSIIQFKKTNLSRHWSGFCLQVHYCKCIYSRHCFLMLNITKQLFKTLEQSHCLKTLEHWYFVHALKKKWNTAHNPYFYEHLQIYLSKWNICLVHILSQASVSFVISNPEKTSQRLGCSYCIGLTSAWHIAQESGLCWYHHHMDLIFCCSGTN